MRATNPNQLSLGLVGIILMLAASCANLWSEGSRYQYQYQPQQQAQASRTCTSDYGCPYGTACAKGYNSMMGTCQAALGYVPRLESTGAGTTNCWQSGCDIGWRCASSGACVR